MVQVEGAAGTVILSFCGICGILLVSGLGLMKSPTCRNCGTSMKDREDRIEGLFSEVEAHQLNEINFEV